VSHNVHCGPQAPGARGAFWPIIAPMTTPTSADVRAHLLEALHADLVGPFDLDPASTEVLPRPPSRFYLTGFLAPSGDRDPGDPTDDEEFATGSDTDDDEQSSLPPSPRCESSSRPLSACRCCCRRGRGDAVTVTLHYAEYYPAPADETPDDTQTTARAVAAPGASARGAHRRPRRRRARAGRRDSRHRWALAGGAARPTDAPGLAPGTRALSLFVVNHRKPVTEPGKADIAFVFQVALEVRYPGGLVPRPNRRDETPTTSTTASPTCSTAIRWSGPWGTASRRRPCDDAGRVVGARTVWLPRAEVRPVVSQEVPGVDTTMEALADVPDGAALRSPSARCSRPTPPGSPPSAPAASTPTAASRRATCSWTTPRGPAPASPRASSSSRRATSSSTAFG
jgi:hypothetical protein